MPKLRSPDDLMKDYLLSTQKQAVEHSRDARIEAEDPGYLTQRSIRERDVYGEQSREFDDILLSSQDRDLGEHLQDAGAGLMGTFGTIGNTAILGVSAAGDALGNLTGTHEGWDATQESLRRMNDTSNYWNDLQSEKSKAFDRLTAYRQDRAIDQANVEAQAERGEDASLMERLTAGFGAAAGSYLDNPGQIVTDGVAQLPYLLTGGLAKGLTTGTAAIRTGAIGVTARETTSRLAAPLINQMVARGMTAESAKKLVQMGLVGGMQGTIEGADAASNAYGRVMDSTDTFGPEDQAARESAALEAAAKAFGIAGVTSAITGTLASKWDLSPFSATGSGVLGRTGDNIVKALQEGVQETIESGTSQFAGNYAGNTVLKGKDLVALDEGVGGAAGTGFVVGMGSTAVTNPRSVVDAAVAPLVLAGKPFGYMADRAAKAERAEDMAAAKSTADTIVANATTPAVAAVLNQATEEVATQSVDTPVEEVVLPAEIDTSSQIGLFATGMEYLRGKDMNSKDAVESFHVLGAVLASANMIRNLRDAAAKDAADTTLPQADRDRAAKQLTQLKGLMDSDKLDKWVADFPMEDIESEMEDLRQNPEAFGSAIAHLAAMNPLKMTPKLIETALESKSLAKPQRDALLLAQELKAAEADLKVSGKPNSEEVTRSMMQTGFPGYRENDSVAGYISRITQALAENDTETAQTEFHRLVKFSNFEQGRAAAYEAAKAQMAADPDSKRIELDGYYQLNDKGKLDKSLPQFVDKKALELVKTVRKDADAIAKMVAAIQKRTGLQAVEKAPESTPAPVAAKEATPTPTKAEKPAEKPASEPVVVQEDAELAAMTDEAIGLEMEALAQAISRRRNNNTGKAVEQDVRYDNLVRETARRMGNASKPTATKPVDKPVAKVAPAKAEPDAAPVDNDESRITPEQAARLSPEGLQARIDAITQKGIQDRTKQDDSTLAVLNAELARRAADAEPEVADIPTEPSKNQYSDLMPSYPVPEGATEAEANDYKNHLSQNFTKSDVEGLASKGEALTNLDVLVEELAASEEDIPAIENIFSLKEKFRERLNQLLGSGAVGIAKAKYLQTNNAWKDLKQRHLFATKWNENGIKYQEDIGQLMAWTGVQQMLDMVNPVAWSGDMINKMEKTYGPAIRQKLMDGWVPLTEQREDLARKLQINLELKGNDNLSTEYTEGTMFALAGRILEAMMTTGSFNGVLQHETFMTLSDEEAKISAIPVQWVRMGVSKKGDMGSALYAAARVMKDFLPERSSTSQAHIGKPPTEVNPFYRNSKQKIGKEQLLALKRRANVKHMLSPLLYKAVNTISGDHLSRFLGIDISARDLPSNTAELSLDEAKRKGKYNTDRSDMNVINEHIKSVLAYAEENGVDPTTVPSFFEYEQVSNGRAMTKGTSPQSSKWYRELFAIAQYVVDPSKENRGFRMAAAQGFGIKMDIQRIDESLEKLDTILAHPDMKRAMEAAQRISTGHDYTENQTLLEEDLSAIEKLSVPKTENGLGIERSPHAMSALIHYAAYTQGKPFTSSLMYEIDGKTDGPINLMMLMGLVGSAADMKAVLGLGGLFFDDNNGPIGVQDMTEQLKSWNGGKKDLYEIITGKATELVPSIFEENLEIVVEKAEDKYKESTKKNAALLMKATLHLVKLAGMAQGDVMKLAMEFERSFSKKSTQAAGYLQGLTSISSDLLNTMLEAISARMDAGTLSDNDLRAVDIFFSHSLGSTKNDGLYFNYAPQAYKNPDGSAFVWDGRPLNYHQKRTAVGTIQNFIGKALFNGLVSTIGPQRSVMTSAASLMQSRVAYADYEMKTRYIAKQKEEVAAGRLHPNQALSKADERKIYNEIFKQLVPHPVLRNTAGLAVASSDRTNGNNLLGSVELDKSRRIETRFFDKSNAAFSHYAGLTEILFEEPGVSFAALSIMAGGDGSMMTGFYNASTENVLDMFDGMYMSPELIDSVGDQLNKEAKANWEHDFIGAIITSLKETETEGYIEWAKNRPSKSHENHYAEMVNNVAALKRQREQQIITMRDINSFLHWVSHMAYSGAAKFDATPLNSTTLGTSTTDPLLDLASDELGTVTNGIRKLSAADVKKLLQDHTFENPVLSGLWKVLAPLVNDNLTVFLSSDKQGMAEFYQQNERREMGASVDGVSVGDRVYVRAVNAETIVHELLHATTKNLTATYFSKPEALTAKQREAMKNLLALQTQFMEIDAETLSPMQQAMVEHTQSIMRNLDPNSALQEFLAYGLSNYHLQRTLGNTKSKLGQLMESVFNAVKALFGFPNGTQSDSMLAQMFSNFATLTEGTQNITYPVSVEDALNAVNLDLARNFGSVISQIVSADAVRTVMNETQGKAGTATVNAAARGIARDRLNKIGQEARTRMQELADTNLFPSMTNEEQTAAEYLQAVFAAGLQIKSDVNSLLARVVDAVRAEGPKAWGSDPALAQARYEYFFQNTKNEHDRVADILSMALVNPEFSEYMEKIILPRQDIDKSSLNNWLDSTAQKVYELTDTGLAIKKDSSLAHVLEVAAIRMQKSMMQSAKRKEAKAGAYRRLTEKLSEGVQYIGEKAGQLAEARLKLKANKDRISSILTAVAGLANDRYADMLGKLTLSLTNELDVDNPFREVMQEMVGTVGDNYKLIQLKGIAARMVSAIRQTFREQVPATVKSWFTDLTPEQDELLHKVIGKMAAYSLSQNLKDRMEELLADPGNAKLDAELVLMSGGNRTKRLLMIKYAKQLGDRMANQGTQALYLNTRAVAGLAVHGGGDVLTDTEMAALENLSTLQALSHLTPRERRQVLEIYRNNTEGFWKTAALINSFHDFDTQRAGENTATLNFQKGWIPVETDGRKKLKLFQKSEVLKAQRLGWVQVGEFANDPNLVYMATTVGKTPTLSGGAIHSVDFHMNGIHYHSGLPTDPSIQTLITHPKAVREIKTRILNGEVMPYTVLYDAAGDVEGFQRQLDPAMMDRHTKTVGRISDAAGIWLGRLHEERVAHSQNQAAADLLRKTWDDGQKDKREREFVNIRQPVDLKDPNAKQDKVLKNVWDTLPYHTKVQLESAFADGSRNPPIWIRKDQLNDAIGYHKASVGNFFTGDNRYEKSTNSNVAALSRQMLGKDAYKYLKTAEEGWQALIGSAKDTIIVKSLVVALNNLASNQTQLFMITGNPVWNLRVQSQKHKELVSYLGYQQRHARLVAEKYATSDANTIKKIQAEQVFLEGEMRKLSIWPLIEAGELPTIAEGLSETEEFSMVGDFTEWVENQMGKLPPVASTILNNLAVSKETSLYKGLDRMVQYGDFVAKATMYEWLTTQDANARKQAFDMTARDTSGKLTITDALHQVALMEVNDEFVNYARLAGRWRTYGEDMGLLWFYNYKLRIMKMTFRRMRKNPVAFIIGSQVGAMLGVATLVDTMPQNINFSYSTGLDPLFSAHQTILWNQLF